MTLPVSSIMTSDKLITASLNELDNAGRVEGASHIPRGMLEVYLDPNSPITKY